jgi:ubiquinone/menaquinone biosynthesis C-methylase UbiE
VNPWSRAATLYDLQLALERRALRTLVEMMDISPSDTLVDVGTGTGAFLRELAIAGVRPARAIGVDSSDRMLARARTVVPPDTELRRADAGELPLPDGSVEVVTAAYLLHLLSADVRAEVLRELGRVLAPGGRLGVVTVAPPKPGVLPKLISAPVRAAAARSSGLLGGLRPLDPGDDLRSCGFDVEAVRRTAAGYPSLCVRARRRRRS